MNVYTAGSVPIKAWTEDVEQGALDQAYNLSNLPFAFRHIALMPDVHQGYGMPIGGVMATMENIVVPNAVGVDIGCGMAAIPLLLRRHEIKPYLKAIVNEIYRWIPVGFGWNERMQDGMPEMDYDIDLPVTMENYMDARRQLGTLGGGNHFIEIQEDQNNYVWVMVHSGSRNLGYKIATHYNDKAREINKKWYSSVPDSWQLAFLTQDGLAWLYQCEMNYAVRFAKVNRSKILDAVLDVMHDVVGDIECGKRIDVAHNYAELEHHFGKNVMVHRKGATRARKNELCVIPGSQGTASYICRGLGNEQSFKSCSHGAGRVMGRKEAKRTLDLEEQKRIMGDIVHRITQKNLDEAPGAYKDIDVVMENQKDLVAIETTLKPLAVVKG